MNVLGAMAKLTFGTLAKAAGAEMVVDAAKGGVDFWKGHFTSHGEALRRAMAQATTDAFKALDIALDGGAWLRSADLKEHGQAMRQWLMGLPLPPQTDRDEFLAACRIDLKTTRKRGGFGGGDPDLAGLIGRAPSAEATLEQEALADLAREAEAAGCKNLAHLFRAPGRGPHVLTEASRFFLLQAISADESLCRVFHLQRIDDLERGQGAVLSEIRAVQRKQDEALQQMRTLLEGKHLERRAVRAFDSMSFRDGRERELVRKMRDAIRALPESLRESLEVQKGLGKLLHGSEQFDEAEKAFAAAIEAADGSADRDAKAEAHFSRFHNALQRKDHETALFELNAAAELRPDLYRLIPTGYVAEKILGAGGFGVAILCQHPHLRKKRVIKALFAEEGDAHQVFAEAGHLADLEHEHIIKVHNCAYVDAVRGERPYLELEHFDGCDLETYVKAHHPLPEADFYAIASGIAQALRYAHGRNPRILHRDVKPSNVLVAKSGGRMLVKLIDFGLAVEQRLRDDAIRLTMNGTNLQAQTTVGTLDYAAPEQLGKIPGATPGPYSDVYGFARTCCFVLFKKPLPTQKNWKQVSQSLSELLDNCLEDEPQERLPDFAAVFEAWEAMNDAPASPAPPAAAVPRAPSAPAAPKADTAKQGAPPPAAPPQKTAEPRGKVVGYVKIPPTTEPANAVPPNDYEALGKRTFTGLELLAKNEFGLHEFWMPGTGAKPVRGKDGQFRIEDGTGMVFVLIPGGTYTIGAQKTDPQGKHYDPMADDDESPVHTVELDPYFLAKYAMTQGQWQRATGKNPSANSNQKDGRERPLAHPVENVSWKECTEVLGSLGLALPTEAQWEAAARAGTTTPWWCGATEKSMKGVIRYESSSQGHAPVDWSRPNPFGLYNILGNVWEWCRDGYGSYATAPRKGDAERMQQGSADRVPRGGSFNYDARLARAAIRDINTPAARRFNLGCRPARGLGNGE